MLALTAFVALVTALGASFRQVEEPSIEQEIEALVAKTNALDSFHLVYEVSPSKDMTRAAEMNLVYRAPDLGHFWMRDETVQVDAWWIGSTMYVDMGKGWRHASMEWPAASRILDERFPREAKQRALPPGVTIYVSFDEDGASATFAFLPAGRSCALGWFEAMRRAEVAREDGVLSWPAKGGRYQVSRESGLLQLVEAEIRSEPRTLRLKSAALDVELDSTLTTPPEEALQGAPDAEMARGMQGSAARVLRELGYTRARARRPWDEQARDDWRVFLDSLHRPVLEDDCRNELRRLEDHLDQLAGRLRTEQGQGDSPDTRPRVEEAITAACGAFEELLGRNEKSLVESLPALVQSEGGREELSAIEREVVSAIWTELVGEPARKAFEERVAGLER